MDKIGLGGGCHWCTEAVFQSLKGVSRVDQGFIASTYTNGGFSEAVIVHFDENAIALRTLIEVHMHTHKSTSNHSMRSKYRSAVYTFTEKQWDEASALLTRLQSEFEKSLITQVLPFENFKPSEMQFVDYYSKNPQKPFCERYIQPKLRLLLDKFSGNVRISNDTNLID